METLNREGIIQETSPCQDLGISCHTRWRQWKRKGKVSILWSWEGGLAMPETGKTGGETEHLLYLGLEHWEAMCHRKGGHGPGTT